MPELPEVETVKRGLEPAMQGAVIDAVEQRRADLRFPLPERFAQRLCGRKVERLERRAKYILVHLCSGEILAIHLGMSGRFTILPGGPHGLGAIAAHADPSAGPSDGVTEALAPHELGRFALETAGTDKHDHIVFTMNNGARIVYNDVRRFGYMDLFRGDALGDHPMFRELGVEPLGNGLNGPHLAALARNRMCDLKAFLLDQKAVAGLGNIYVCEALYRARLSPRRKAASLACRSGGPGARAERLTGAIREVLREAIAAGGSTLKDYAATDGELGYFQHSFAVYGRAGQPCRTPGCKGVVQRIVQSGRSTFFCGLCQR